MLLGPIRPAPAVRQLYLSPILILYLFSFACSQGAIFDLLDLPGVFSLFSCISLDQSFYRLQSVEITTEHHIT